MCHIDHALQDQDIEGYLERGALVKAARMTDHIWIKAPGSPVMFIGV